MTTATFEVISDEELEAVIGGDPSVPWDTVHSTWNSVVDLLPPIGIARSNE